MALLDLFSVVNLNLKNLLAVFPFALYKNTLAVGGILQPQGHFIATIRAPYLSNLSPPKNGYKKGAPRRTRLVFLIVEILL